MEVLRSNELPDSVALEVHHVSSFAGCFGAIWEFSGCNDGISFEGATMTGLNLIAIRGYDVRSGQEIIDDIYEIFYTDEESESVVSFAIYNVLSKIMTELSEIYGNSA